MTESQRLIASLRDQGYSNRAIARAIGRNDSLVSQIARGIKPGNNLAGALRELAGGNTAPAPPPRRLAASGEPARVRGGRRPSPSPGAPQTAARGGTVTFSGPNGETVTFRGMPPGTVGETAKGSGWALAGWSPAWGSGQDDRYRDLAGGDRELPPASGDVIVTVYIDGTGYRQLRVYVTESFTLPEAIRAAVDAAYGKR